MSNHSLLHIGQTHPTMDELAEYVVPLLAAKWYGLGLVLLETKYKDLLDVMKKQQPKQDMQIYCKKVLRKWLETSDIASWYQLIEAARCLDVKDVADYIESLLLQGNCTVMQ